MNKLNKLITGIKVLMSKPYLINKVIDDESLHQDIIKKSHPQFSEGIPVIEITQLLPEINEEITPYSFLGGGSLITDLVLLKGLAKLYPDCFYFEIGTWRGESVANVATVTPNCFTFNLPTKNLIELGCNDEYIEQQEFFSKNINSITHLKGDSTNFDFSPYYGKCDLVFIDGDHRYAGVLNDTKIAYKLLKDENSIIVWHDYLNHSDDIRWDVVRGILDGSTKKELPHLYNVSNTLCAVYTKKPLKPLSITKVLTPNKVFKVIIEAKNL